MDENEAEKGAKGTLLLPPLNQAASNFDASSLRIDRYSSDYENILRNPDQKPAKPKSIDASSEMKSATRLASSRLRTANAEIGESDSSIDNGNILRKPELERSKEIAAKSKDDSPQMKSANTEIGESSVINITSSGGGLKSNTSRTKTELPAIDELTTALNISVEHLQSCKRETYQRTFRLWMPMVHDFDAAAEEDADAAELATEVLPVDELLDRVMLRRVRVSAVERSILFLLFNFLYCACLIMQRSLSDSFELEFALKSKVDSGRLRFSTGVTTVESIWDWMETSFVDSLSPETNWYNGDAMESKGYTSYYNKQCGGFSLVQHRVNEYPSKPYTPAFHTLYPTVWPDLGTDASTSKSLQGLFEGDDQRSFGPAHDVHKYRWTADSAGEFGGGGYTVRFPTEKQMVLYKLAELKKDRFIDKQTRKLQFIVTVFNANLKLFATIDFQVMLNAAGAVETKKAVSSVRINQFVGAADYIRVCLELILIGLMVQHTRKEVLTARVVGIASYLNFWNLIDAARQVLFYVCMVMYVVVLFDPLRMNPDKVEDMCNGGHWVNFPKLAKLEEDFVFNSALCLLMSTLLIFKFLTPFPKFGIFVHTMIAAGKDLINFVMILLILLFGFSIIGHLLFGHVLFEYSTVSSSFETAVLNSIGIFDYPEMVEASGNLAAAIYFFTFVFIITMVVMQMVIAIIFSAYDGLREQIDDAEELEIGPTLIRRAILGRDPSLKELEDPLFTVIKGSFKRLCKRLGKLGKQEINLPSIKKAISFNKVLPQSKEGERVTPDTFGDAHLLQLFDPQHVFRMYGILSPKMENEIINVKIRVAKEREIAKKAVSKMFKFSKMTSTRVSGEEEKNTNLVADLWALNRAEFCALVDVLDVLDDAMHITSDKVTGNSDSNAMRIAHHIFTAYGRKHQSIAGDGKFRKRVLRKLDNLTKICATEAKTQGASRNDKVSSGAFGLGSLLPGGGDGSSPSSTPRRQASMVISDARNVKVVQNKQKQRLSLLLSDMSKS